MLRISGKSPFLHILHAFLLVETTEKGPCLSLKGIERVIGASLRALAQATSGGCQYRGAGPERAADFWLTKYTIQQLTYPILALNFTGQLACQIKGTGGGYEYGPGAPAPRVSPNQLGISPEQHI